MIQRIQSVYLLLATIVTVVAMCLPIGTYLDAQALSMASFTPLGLSLANGDTTSTWALLVLLLFSALLSLAAIFLFRNRQLQMRTTVFNALLLLGYYVATVVFIFMLKDSIGAETFRPGLGLAFPAMSIIFCYLAFRGIYRDDVMVKAADRLR